MDLFFDPGFMPHIHCYLGSQALIGTMLVTDLMIGLAYVCISFILLLLIHRTRLAYSRIIVCFGAFIGACGATHFMEVWTLWHPDYWVSASVKILTALASVGTGIYLFRLRHVIVSFADSIRLSEQRKQDLENLTRNLEERVSERTKEIEKLGSRLMRAANVTDLGAFHSDLPFDKLTWSARTKEHFWATDETDIDMDLFYTRVHPEDRERVKDAISHAISARQAYDIEYRSVNPRNDRDWKWIRAVGWADYENETPISFDGLTLDLTERKKRESEKEQLKGELADILERTTEGFFIIDREWRMSYANPVTKNFFAIAGQEITGKPMTELFPSPDRAKFMKHYEAIAGTGIAERFEESYEGHILQVHSYRTRDGGVAVFYRDATEQVEASNRLKESENRYATLTRSIPQLVWTCLADGSCNYLSQQWEEYTGMSAEQQLGYDWLDRVIHPDDRQRTLDHWMGAVEGKNAYDIEYRIKRYDGVYRWFRTRGTQMRNDVGQVIYWVGTCTDIQDTKETETRLEDAVKKANAANELKSAFLANMSHEIRTPLGAVLGFTELLRDKNLNPSEIESYHEIVKRNGEQLSNLINDILDLSKVEAGQFQAEITVSNVAEVAEDVVMTLDRKAKEKGLGLKCRIDGSVPKTFYTDPFRLRQILINLIGNSIKFTHVGAIELDVVRDSGKIKFTVSDTGIGLTELQAKGLFQAFSQADPSITRKYGGTGLGLILSRRLAEALGGELNLERTEAGKGSVFSFTISDLEEVAFSRQRTVAPNSENSLKSQRASESRPLDNRRILVVDDSPDNRHLLSRILQRQGAEVVSAENGLEAVEVARTQDFDIILMDIQMPVMDGYTAITRLRESGYRVPIIALTAHAMNEVRIKTLNVGASDYMTKPINSAELSNKIAKWIDAD
jgi:PAS domain S-box-containing protein